MLTIEKSTIVENENKDAKEIEIALTGLRTRIRSMDTQAQRGTDALGLAKDVFRDLRDFEIGSEEYTEATIVLTGLYEFGYLETPNREIAVEVEDNIAIIVGSLAVQRYSTGIAA